MRKVVFTFIVLVTLVGLPFAFIELPTPEPYGKAAASVEEQKITLDLQKTALTSAVELIRLLIGWSVALIGGIAYLYGSTSPPRHAILVLTCAIPTLWSLFFGYLALDRVVLLFMLENVTVQDKGLNLAIRLQYLLFLAALIGFICLAISAVSVSKDTSQRS